MMVHSFVVAGSRKSCTPGCGLTQLQEELVTSRIYVRATCLFDRNGMRYVVRNEARDGDDLQQLNDRIYL